MGHRLQGEVHGYQNFPSQLLSATEAQKSLQSLWSTGGSSSKGRAQISCWQIQVSRSKMSTPRSPKIDQDQSIDSCLDFGEVHHSFHTLMKQFHPNAAVCRPELVSLRRKGLLHDLQFVPHEAIVHRILGRNSYILKTSLAFHLEL